MGPFCTKKSNKKIFLAVLVSIIVISLAISTAYLMTDVTPSLNDPKVMLKKVSKFHRTLRLREI